MFAKHTYILNKSILYSAKYNFQILSQLSLIPVTVFYLFFYYVIKAN